MRGRKEKEENRAARRVKKDAIFRLNPTKILHTMDWGCGVPRHFD
jgi:hypothetical protein